MTDGAVSYWIDRAVSTRKARFSYGVSTCTKYDPLRNDHIARESLVFRDVDDIDWVKGRFSTILTKVRRTFMGHVRYH